MSKAENFISDCTRNCSNLMQVPTLDDRGNIVPKTHPWLTPDQARRAVEIRQEEMIEWLDSHWREYINVDADGVVCFGHWKNDLRKAMKDG